ncbi:hypothetical protein BDV96DRAFT_498932 [Lophiotrema nucula]|uniref:RING-CH-type domain-containing protein n=1 Tax=Lophiotrema nucula TaxID=690887 RepID=A0A6A5YYU3_9PLEO|nr:hypothetical protein BDV96DRAFT_498932 [Lophiotrema nucula]
MASLPPQRRAARSASGSDSTQQDLNRTNSEAYSATSEDSQTLLLNSPPASSSKPAAGGANKDAQPASSLAPQADTEPRKCWICFTDETEDDENTSEWRSPCPCALVAHEKCLLDWIADMEAPTAGRRAGGKAGKILCPQCKSEIRLQRPRSVVVDTIRVGEKLTGALMIPAFVALSGTAVYLTAKMLGTHAIIQVFGDRDAYQILEPILSGQEELQHGHASVVVQTLHHMARHWRLSFGLPLIPTTLILSRTSIADGFLPFLPLIFFVSSGTTSPGDSMREISWPPSAAFSIATLPYVRMVYNAGYERFLRPQERRWLKEIQPRAGTDEANNERDNHDHNHDDDDILADDTDDEGLADEVVEVEVDLDIFGEWNNGGAADNHNAPENPPVPIARGPAAPPIDAPPLQDNEPAPAPNVPQQPQRVRRERELRFSTASLADTLMGALVFPSIAAAVGEALKYALPKSWVTPPAFSKPTSFLQARWGRSILGGCLFVGVKDALLLYVRWRMAQNHRQRKVLDYDKKKHGKSPK